MYIFHFPARTSALKDGRLNERSNHEQEDNSFDLCGGNAADGESGMRWGNNHTHFCEYQGTNYILHHTLLLEELTGGTAGFCSLMVDYLPMNAE